MHRDGYGVVRALRGLPWQREGGDFRFLRRVSRWALEDVGIERPVVPFGWIAEYELDTDGYLVGPAWVILPRRWYRELRWRFYRVAKRHGAIELREGDLFSNARWWPAQRWG